MTKKGFCQILVRDELHQILKSRAGEQGCSIAKYIQYLLQEQYRYRIDTASSSVSTALTSTISEEAQNNPHSPNGFSLKAFHEKASWCGGWDSDPCSPKARDLESCAFSPFGDWPGSATPASDCLLPLLTDNCFRYRKPDLPLM